jgi:hypothetical protein
MPRQKGATVGTRPCGGAGTPEELETLLEDALITGDRESLTALFEDHAIFVRDNGHAARGHEIAGLVLGMWQGDHRYIADPRSVIQARDIALIVTEEGINVARRGHDGTWHYVVIFQAFVNGLYRSTT